MSRKRSGTVVYVEARDDEAQGHYRIRVTANDGSRPWFDLAPGPKSPQAEARARETAASYSERMMREGIVAAPKRRAVLKAGDARETFEAWVIRWLDARAAKGLRSVETDRGRIKKWLTPSFAGMAMRAITKRDLETLVERLDRAVQDGELAWKTALNTWGLVTKMFDDAKNAKALALRVIDENPAAEVRGPDHGIRRANTFVYPSDFLSLVSCEDIALEGRIAVALAIYTYTRASELRGLTWDAVDLERSILHVHMSQKRDEDEAEPTKTGTTRRFTIEPALRPLLHALREASGGKGRVVDLPDDRHLARWLRDMLVKAGVTREELFADDETRRPVTWHSLRATGITWRAIRGDDPIKIQRAAGHSTFSTTSIYIKEAEGIGDGFGEVFPHLPESLLGTAQGTYEPSSDTSRAKLTIENHCGGAGNRKRPNLEKAEETAGFVEVSSEEPPNFGVQVRDPSSAKTPRGESSDPVEAALAGALERASAAGQWSTVEALAKELGERRRARESAGRADVIDLEVERAKRGVS